MKILHVIDSLAGGGAERLVSQLAPLMNRGVSRCHVLILSDKNAVYFPSLLDSGVIVHIAPYKNMYDFRTVLYIRRLIKNEKYDIVHAHLFPSIYWVSLATYCLGRKVKLLMTEHSTYNRRRGSPWMKFPEQIIYCRYDIVISISEGTQKALLDWIKPRKTQKFVVIENGIDVGAFKDSKPLPRNSLGIAPEPFLLGMVGSFSRQKNHRAIINALQMLPCNIHLVFAGSGPLLETTIALAKALGADNRTHFLGFRSDIERVIKTVDMIVIPSLWEGFGLVAVEAMACGKPISASNVPGLKEVVSNCGVFFDPTDPEDIAKKISILISDNALFSRCAEQALIRADEFGVEKMGEKHIQLYIDLLGVRLNDEIL